MGHGAGTWLCPTEADRARMLEAGTRVRAARVWVSAGTGAALLASAPWVGWLPVLFSALAVAQIATLDRRVNRSARPEIYVAGSFAFTALAIAAGVAVTGGPRSELLPLLALPTILMANRFRRSVVLAGLAAALGLMLLCTVPVDPGGILDAPQEMFVTTALLVGVVVFTLSLSDTEMRLRDESRFDHLTGLLNRAALGPRFAELQSQAAATDGEVAVVVYDLDRFKSVNDDLGHDVGDDVLRDTALQLRRHLRGFDLVYRLGGEEFAVVLPGLGTAEARDIANRQREAIQQARPGGVPITISGGVASGRGAAVAWDDLYRRADAALLRAKREGRNRIVCDGDAVAPPPVGPPPFLRELA